MPYPTDASATFIMAGVMLVVIMGYFTKKGRNDMYHWVLSILGVMVIILALFYARVPGKEAGSTVLSLIAEVQWPPHWPWSN